MDGSDWIALGALAVAALSVVKDFFLERSRGRREVELKRFEVTNAASLKKYEVTFLQKRQSFGDLFGAFRRIVALATNGTAGGAILQDLSTEFGNETAAIYGLLPFLGPADREWLGERCTAIEASVNNLWSTGPSLTFEGRLELSMLIQRDVVALRAELFPKLFPE